MKKILKTLKKKKKKELIKIWNAMMTDDSLPTRFCAQNEHKRAKMNLLRFFVCLMLILKGVKSDIIVGYARRYSYREGT